MTVPDVELSRNAKKQLRIPAGNGPRSGRWVDDPRTQAADLASKMVKRRSASAVPVSAIAARLDGLQPDSPDWFDTLAAASDGLRSLGGLSLVDAEAVEALAEELDFLMLADWADDFEGLGFEQEQLELEQLNDFSEFEPEPLAR